jgi:4-hydroxy-tetrahydrodipicolinate synthase
MDVAAAFLKRIGARIPVIVGVSNPGMAQLVKLARFAMENGAAGVMVQPIAGLKTDEAVEAYVKAVIAALGAEVPVCFQDYPQLTGVFVSASAFVRMVDAHPSIVMLKHEEAPGLRKLTTIRRACDGRERRYISILCGNGGMHLPQEYRRGADGAMTGFAYPEMLVAIDRLFKDGQADTAEDLYDAYLPLLRHEGQMGIGLALRKEILRRRGAIASGAARAPGPKLDADDVEELDVLMRRLQSKLDQRV